MVTYTTPGIAIVTGASSGIGRACAIALSHAGWTVVVRGRRADQLEQTIKPAQDGKADSKLKAVAGDLAKPEDVKALFDVVEKEYGTSRGMLPCVGWRKELTRLSRLMQDGWIFSSTCVRSDPQSLR